MKSTRKSLLIVIGLILGFIFILIGYYYMTLKSYSIKVENNELVMKLKDEGTKKQESTVLEVKRNTSSTVKDTFEKFSIKNNFMSIVILIIGVIIYIIAKRREHYVKREKD